MLHFAGAASRHQNQRLPDALRVGLRRSFTEHISGTCDAYDGERVLMLLENRRAALPQRFFHFVSETSAWTLMLSGLVYEGPVGSRPDAPGLVAQLTPFTNMGFAGLVGDFSIAAWNHATGHLMLASSFMGVQPLYWTQTDMAVIWSSSLALVRAYVRALEIDRTFLSTFLVLQRSVERSPYRNVRALRPGAVMTVRGDDTPHNEDVTTFADEDLVLRDEREYAERLASLVTTAVADRMPAKGLCFSELSGGLDSSTVAAVASRVARSTGVTLQTIHYTSRSSPEWDETRFAHAVAAQANLRMEIINLDDLPYLDLIDDVSPEIPMAGERAAAALARANGAEVLLSGRVGDAVFGNVVDNSLATVDHLRTRQYKRFFQTLLDWSIASNRPIIALLGAMTVAHVAPTWHDCLLQRQRTRRQTAAGARWDNAEAYSVRPAVMVEASRERALFTGLANRFVRPSKRRLLNAICAYSLLRALENKLNDLVMLYPFVDPRVVRYLLSIPPTLHSQPTETRYLMRRAFSDLWPAPVQQRIAKGYAGPAACRLVRPYAVRLHEQREYLLADLGLLDPDAFRRRLQHFLSASAARVGNLYRIWYAEEWLRQFTGAGSLVRDSEGPPTAAPVRSLPQRVLTGGKEVT